MDANTQIIVRTEIVGQGTVDPNIYRGKLGSTKDFNFVPQKGWKVATVYLRPLSQKEGRTPEYKYGHQISTEPGYLLPDGTPLYNHSDEGLHLSIGPDGVAKLNTINGDIEHILRVEFVPDGSVPPSYNGPTLEEMDVKAEIAAIKARLTKAGL